MANPFPSAFDNKTCDSCGDFIFEGDPVYAVDGQFVCKPCAEENSSVCKCGNFKKEGFAECYGCSGGLSFS